MSIYEEKRKITKERIQNAFIGLLEEKAFETITIGDITKAAHINRGTFYLHYLDKFDLLEQLEQQFLSAFVSHIDDLQSRYLAAPTFESEQEQLADTLFRYIKTRAPMLKLLLGDHGGAGFHLRFRAAFSEKVQMNIERHESFYDNLNVPITYFVAFITSAFLGLIEQWLQDDLSKSEQEMTAIYIDIISFIQKK